MLERGRRHRPEMMMLRGEGVGTYPGPKFMTDALAGTCEHCSRFSLHDMLCTEDVWLPSAAVSIKRLTYLDVNYLLCLCCVCAGCTCNPFKKNCYDCVHTCTCLLYTSDAADER